MIVTESPSTQRPVTLDEAKDHLRVYENDEDAEILAIIDTAALAAERYCRFPFTSRTITATDYRFRDSVILPTPVIHAFTSITYVDVNGDTQTLDAAEYDVLMDEPPSVLLGIDKSWPDIAEHRQAVTYTYEGGYAPDGADYRANIPRPLRHCVLLMCGELYEHREAREDFAASENPTYMRMLNLYAHRVVV